MKNILVLFLLTALTALAAEVPDARKIDNRAIPATPGFYNPGLSFDLFGSLRSTDLNDERLGTGLGVNLWFANNLGVGLETSTENTAGDFLDTVSGNGLWRITSGRAALNLLGGVGQNIETDETFFQLGGGPEYAITRRWHVFGDARAVKPLEGSDIEALFRAGLRLQW